MKPFDQYGYYLAKFLDKPWTSDIWANVGNLLSTYSLMIRLSDILLSYAEAMHHAYGMNVDPEGYGLTAEAVQKIRSRAGFRKQMTNFLME